VPASRVDTSHRTTSLLRTHRNYLGPPCREFYTVLATALHFRNVTLQRNPNAHVWRVEDSMNEEQIKGKAEKAKGYVKQKAGEVTGNENLEAEGAADRVAGKARETMGNAKEKVKDAIDDLDC